MDTLNFCKLLKIIKVFCEAAGSSSLPMFYVSFSISPPQYQLAKEDFALWDLLSSLILDMWQTLLSLMPSLERGWDGDGGFLMIKKEIYICIVL